MSDEDIGVNEYEFSTTGESDSNFIPIGCPSVELLLTNKIGCCFRKGSVVRLKGDPGSGKSMLGMHILAQCAKDNRCKDMNMHYFDKEAGIVGLDLYARFGKKVANRINYIHSEDLPDTIEGMHSLIRKKCQEKASVIIVDSLDTLMADKEKKLAKEAEELREAGKEIPEPPMMLAARASKAEWRKTNAIIASTNSVVILISQTISTPSPYATSFQTSGGNANEFYASICLGLRTGDKIQKKDRYGNIHEIGVRVRAIPTKNRQTAIIKEEAICTLYFNLGFVPQEDVLEFLTKKTDSVKENRGCYTCDWLTGSDKGVRRGNLIKELINNQEMYNKALTRMQDEWNNIRSCFTDVFD